MSFFCHLRGLMVIWINLLLRCIDQAFDDSKLLIFPSFCIYQNKVCKKHFKTSTKKKKRNQPKPKKTNKKYLAEYWHWFIYLFEKSNFIGDTPTSWRRAEDQGLGKLPHTVNKDKKTEEHKWLHLTWSRMTYDITQFSIMVTIKAF